MSLTKAWPDNWLVKYLGWPSVPAVCFCSYSLHISAYGCSEGNLHRLKRSLRPQPYLVPQIKYLSLLLVMYQWLPETESMQQCSQIQNKDLHNVILNQLVTVWHVKGPRRTRNQWHKSALFCFLEFLFEIAETDIVCAFHTALCDFYLPFAMSLVQYVKFL